MVEALKVLTLNTWGLWIVSKQREARMHHLAQYLERAKHLDVVVLQEVWVDQDAERLLRAARKAGLAHGMHFKSGLFGSGLVTLSRFPILQAGFQRYTACGDAMALHCGDYYAGKGVGWVRLDTPLGLVDVFNTHLHANYSHKTLSGDLALTPAAGAVDQGSGGKALPRVALPANIRVPQDRFAPYRVAQICQLAEVVRTVGGSGHLTSAVILAGDINTEPDLLEMALLRCLLPELRDSWTAVHGTTAESEAAGLTCRTPNCSYRSTRQVPERIDYILVAGLRPVQASVELERTPAGHSYSDHAAVMAHLAAPATPQLPQPALPQQSSARLGVSTGKFDWLLASGTADGAQQATAEQQSTAVQAALSKLLAAALLMLSKGAKNKANHASQKLSRSLLALILAVSVVVLLPLGELLPPWHPVRLAHPAVLALLVALLTAVGVVGFLMAQLADKVQARTLQQCHAQLQTLALALDQQGASKASAAGGNAKAKR